MNINEKLLKSIEFSLDYKGIDIESIDNFKKDFFNIREEIEKDNVRTYIQAKYMDNHMFLYTFASMLRNNEINISYNKNTINKHVEYLNKLSEGF